MSGLGQDEPDVGVNALSGQAGGTEMAGEQNRGQAVDDLDDGLARGKVRRGAAAVTRLVRLNPQIAQLGRDLVQVRVKARGPGLVDLRRHFPDRLCIQTAGRPREAEI